MSRAIGLLSGGLDSMLAVCVLREQGVEVKGLAFTTPFFDAVRAERAASQLDVPLIVRDITEEHLEVVLHPRYGWGSGVNPCIDCHALMLKVAGRIMEEEGFDFLFTGEVLGQRPMSQTLPSLKLVARLSGYEGRILRPLSAKLLDETIPEREGKVDRERLLDLSGRGRKPQIALAEHYGITDYPAPAGGCILTDPIFSRRMKDLIKRVGEPTVHQIELLKVGRHLKLADRARIIVGRWEEENKLIEALFKPEEGDWLLVAESWPGPLALVAGGAEESLMAEAAAICLSYSDAPQGEPGIVVASTTGGTRRIETSARPRTEFQSIMV
jgi:tRNA U34 2-thiouridine synthase MnmA/TrmU